MATKAKRDAAPSGVKAKKTKAEKTPKAMKAPGVKAQTGGTTLKRGAAMQVMTYPRPKTKEILVKASRIRGRSLSSFLLLAGLQDAALALGRQLNDLGIPEKELAQYV